MNNLDISVMSDTQAEGCVLASVIAHSEFIMQLSFLQPGHFYNVENACLWWSCQELINNGITNIDAINLSNAINSNSAIKNKISEYNITNIQEFINMSHYAARDSIEEVKLLAKNITTMAFKRDLNKATMQIQRNCFNQDIQLNELNSMVNKSINGLMEKYIISDELKDYGSKVKDIWKEIVERRTENGLSGIPFLIPSLNEYLTLEKTELVAIAAKFKTGKSALIMNQAIYAIKNGIPTAYFDTEMNDRLFHERLLANLTGVPVKQIKNGNYSYEEEQKLAKANEWLESKPFYHIYLPDHTNEEVYAMHKVLKNKIGLELSCFDYLKSNVSSSSENYNILGQKVDFLKNSVCGELDIAMLTAVQLNRENQVSDSDKINRYASAIIYWEPKTSEEISNCGGLDCGNYKVRVVTNRLGEQMDEDSWIDASFDGNRMRIKEAKQHHKQDTPFS